MRAVAVVGAVLAALIAVGFGWGALSPTPAPHAGGAEVRETLTQAGALVEAYTATRGGNPADLAALREFTRWAAGGGHLPAGVDPGALALVTYQVGPGGPCLGTWDDSAPPVAWRWLAGQITEGTCPA